MKRVRVLIVDDSALMRQILTQIIGADPELEVVGTAAHPEVARVAIEKLSPDVLTLDVEMPKEDGISFLAALMQSRPMPVVMVSSLTERGCETTLRALELGAVDFVAKPKIDIQRGTVQLGQEIIDKVKSAARAQIRKRPVRSALGPLAAPAFTAPMRLRTTQKIVVIGSSTGGTEALREILVALPPNSPPIAIVQHMPPVFTRQFAERLDKLCRVRVSEAKDGQALVPGTVLIAPGGETHLQIVRSGANYGVHLVATAPVGHHRPSVDVMFESCARAAGENAVGVILTGMGADGARGMLAMRRAGAITMAQDENSCVVFGMPKEAIACGGAQHVLPLDKIAGALLGAVHETTNRRIEDRS